LVSARTAKTAAVAADFGSGSVLTVEAEGCAKAGSEGQKEGEEVSEGNTPHLDYHKPSRERRHSPHITVFAWVVICVSFALICAIAAGIVTFEFRYFD
jgi:hypothetical protein